MHVTCPHCLATNRVSPERVAENPRCGQCRSELLPAVPLPVDTDGLRRFVDRTDLPVLVDFWADWCGPCRAMAPAFAEAAGRRPAVRFLKVDTDAQPKASLSYRIRSIPTLILFQGGREIARMTGATSTRDLLAWLDAQLKSRPDVPPAFHGAPARGAA